MNKKLIDYFPDGAISLIESARNWQDAIDISMAPLLKNKIINSSYVEAIKKSTIDNGPYYVLAPQVAMPHARPEQGANGTALTLTILKKGVVFDEANEPVKLLLGLSAVDATSHLMAIQSLCEILSDDDALDNILAATSETEVMSILNQY